MEVKTKRLDFTRCDRQGRTERVGYLDLAETSDNSAQLTFYGDIVSSDSWWSEYFPDDKCPQNIADFLNQIDSNAELTVCFNSGGGDVFAGIAIYNILGRHKGKKIGIVEGLAASIASVILMACDDITVKTGAQVMVHKPWSYAWGNANDMREVIKTLDKCEESVLDIYMKKAKDGITREHLAEMMAAETWMSADEVAETFNVNVDESPAAAACTNSAFFDKYRNIPKSLNRYAEKSEAEEILSDLYLYGI